MDVNLQDFAPSNPAVQIDEESYTVQPSDLGAKKIAESMFGLLEGDNGQKYN